MTEYIYYSPRKNKVEITTWVGYALRKCYCHGKYKCEYFYIGEL